MDSSQHETEPGISEGQKTSAKPKRRAASTGLSQTYQIQDFTFACLMSLRETLGNQKGKLVITRDDALAVAALARAHDGAQERIRIHRGKPLPGTLKPSSKKPGRGSKTPQGPVAIPATSPQKPSVFEPVSEPAKAA